MSVGVVNDQTVPHYFSPYVVPLRHIVDDQMPALKWVFHQISLKEWIETPLLLRVMMNEVITTGLHDKNHNLICEWCVWWWWWWCDDVCDEWCVWESKKALRRECVSGVWEVCERLLLWLCCLCVWWCCWCGFVVCVKADARYCN